MCKPSPPSHPWTQRRLAPYFRQATVALHPAHPHNLGLPMGLSECHLVFCTMGLPESKPPLATFGFLVTGSGLTPWIAVSSAHPRSLARHDAGHNFFLQLDEARWDVAEALAYGWSSPMRGELGRLGLESTLCEYLAIGKEKWTILIRIL